MPYPSDSIYPSEFIYPGIGGGVPEDPIVWGTPQLKTVEFGCDRGVIYLNDGASAPWNGLSSVDESGGENFVEYYLDGRPYLYISRPKEYRANIKAYTYPDEFSQIIGLAEVAAGMYIDSQVGDSFGLSYRTQILDAISGADAGYKTHLIYKASVVPSARSYQSMGDSISPVDFSWEIAAVPKLFSGHRPTAHIILDSRKIASDKMEIIENVMYGVSGSPLLPPADWIYTVLTT